MNRCLAASVMVCNISPSLMYRSQIPMMILSDIKNYGNGSPDYVVPCQYWYAWFPCQCKP